MPMPLIIPHIDKYIKITNDVDLHVSNIFNGYEIDCETTDDKFFRVIYNINNGYNNPYKEIEEIVNCLTKYYKRVVYKQLSIFETIK